MARLVRLYMHYAGISIRSQMQYRASFAMAAAGHLVVTGFDFAALAVLFRRFGSLVEWSLHESCTASPTSPLPWPRPSREASTSSPPWSATAASIDSYSDP